MIAFAIMPNHLHCILYFPTEEYDLNMIVGNAKRFMAYEIVKRLEKQNQNEILYKLSVELSQEEKRKGQLHKLFNPSFDAKPIYSDHFFFQKLEYIHYNPVKGKWNLAKDFTQYPHSSACFYELQKFWHFQPTHYGDLE